MKVYKTKEYRIMSVTSGKLLTANEDQLITVEAADEQKAQNWKFFPEENGCYRIVSTKSKKVVDIIAGGTVNGFISGKQSVQTVSFGNWKRMGKQCASLRCPAENIWMLLWKITAMYRFGKEAAKISFGRSKL